MKIKDKINLTTDMGTNVLAVLAPVLTYFLSLPESHVKSGLVAFCVILISVDLYLIRGTKLNDASSVRRVAEEGSAEEVLEQGREP